MAALSSQETPILFAVISILAPGHGHNCISLIPIAPALGSKAGVSPRPCCIHGSPHSSTRFLSLSTLMDVFCLWMLLKDLT